MNLLDLLKEFCRRVGITPPTLVIASQDDQYMQLVGLLGELFDFITTSNWEQLSAEATFTTVAIADQGPITTLASGGFMWLRNKTFFDRTNGMEVQGPVNDADWQALQALPSSGTNYAYRFRNNHLFITPTPVEGLTFAFEYATKELVYDYTGVSKRTYYAADTDLCLIPASILLAGLKWLWKRESGFRYAEDFTNFQSLYATHLGNNGGKKDLCLDSGESQQTGILVPTSSWSIQ